MAFCIFAHTRLVSISFAIACFAVPIAARGEGAVGTPTYAHDSDAVEVIYGTITSFDGRYALQVRDDRGFFDNVEMVQGTIINPTGERLRAGMRVAVRGPNRGFVLVATQIDTRGVPLLVSAVPKTAALSADHVRQQGRNRELQLQAEMQHYRAEQEAYQRAQAAHRRAEEAKARAAAQSLARKLARLNGGQGWPVAAKQRTPHPSKPASLHPGPSGQNKRPVASKPPPKAIAPIQFSDPAIANERSAPPWFGWGKL